MLQFCNFGAVGPDKQTFATIAVRVFQEGYDFRHWRSISYTSNDYRVVNAIDVGC